MGFFSFEARLFHYYDSVNQSEIQLYGGKYRDANHFNILSGRIGLRIREVSIKCVQFNGSSQSKNQGGIEICAAIHTKIIQFSGSLPDSLVNIIYFIFSGRERKRHSYMYKQKRPSIDLRQSSVKLWGVLSQNGLTPFLTISKVRAPLYNTK